MSTVAKDLFKNYKSYVYENPKNITQIESFARLLSYISSGTSSVFSELLYSAANLLVLLNDSILRQAHNVKFKLPLPHDKLCMWLTVLEFVQVFLEISAQTAAGEAWRWVVVVCVHVAKAALRFVVLRCHGSGILSTPPVQPLKRAAELAPQPAEPEQDEEGEEKEIPRQNGVTFVLPHSGRKVRSLAAKPRTRTRSWSSPEGAPLAPPKRLVQTVLTQSQMLGEYLHIARPLVHLLSMYALGKGSWKPWLIAGGIDITSTFLLGDIKDFNSEEAKEIRRRNAVLLCYLLRTPFYEEYTRERLLAFLAFMADRVPLARFVCRPLLEYLPYWQRIYCYSWMS